MDQSISRTLNEFRSKEKYCDVKVRVGQKCFYSHRPLLAALSQYFDDKFDGSIGNDSVEDVILSNIDPDAFEKILDHMYTGELGSIEDVYSVLEACDYLKIRSNSIEDQCMNALRNLAKKNKPLDNGFALLKFADANNRTGLIEFLKKHIFDHAEYFFQQDNFFKLSYDDVVKIFDGYSGFQNPNVKVDALIRWIICSRPERGSYIKEVLNHAEVTKLLPVLVERLFDRCKYLQELVPNNEPNIERGSVTASKTLVVQHHKKKTPQICNFKMAARDKINVFIKYSNDEMMRVISRNESTKWWQSNKFKNADTIQNCVMDNNLYSLVCVKNSSSFVSQSFLVNTPTELKQLALPPLIMEHFKLSAGQTDNSIYLHNVDAIKGIKLCKRVYNESSFSEEDLARGMFIYKPATNHWYCMPQMDTIVENACMTTDDKSLYFIGGQTSTWPFHQERLARAFDYRTRKWRKLADPLYPHIDGACCMHQGKIYVSGNDDDQLSSSVEVYDPVADKWEELLGQRLYGRSQHLISYADKLWAIGCDNENDSCFEMYYDASELKWCSSEHSLIKAVTIDDRSNVFSVANISIKDVIVF